MSGYLRPGERFRWKDLGALTAPRASLASQPHVLAALRAVVPAPTDEALKLKRPSAEGVENCRAGRAKGRESDATLSAVGVFFQKID